MTLLNHGKVEGDLAVQRHPEDDVSTRWALYWASENQNAVGDRLMIVGHAGMPRCSSPLHIQLIQSLPPKDALQLCPSCSQHRVSSGKLFTYSWSFLLTVELCCSEVLARHFRVASKKTRLYDSK